MRAAVIAEAIVRTVKAGTAPLVSEIAGLRASTAALVSEIAALHERIAVLEARAPIPGPPGERGERGADGLGFGDLRVEYDDRRTLTFAFERGGERQAWPIVLPIPINRGVFKHGKDYDVGDEITHHGSLWRCDVATAESPPGNGWRLIVKKIRGERQADG